jgi:xanthine dehydrogenase accessory factor
VIETRRGHTLGRVYWNGTTLADSREPEGDPRRVLRAPADGFVTARKKIGEHCEEGEVVAVISDQMSVISDQRSVISDQRSVTSPFRGVLRGIIHDGLRVRRNMKIGDVDPRDDPAYCFLVSDKALAVGGGVLEAVVGFESRMGE